MRVYKLIFKPPLFYKLSVSDNLDAILLYIIMYVLTAYFKENKTPFVNDVYCPAISI